MDLRPKIVAEIVDALLDDIPRWPFPGERRAEIRERWIKEALTKFVSHNIPFPGSGWDICSNDPQVIKAFLAKYPEVVPFLEVCKVKALEMWPGASFEIEVMRDPEGCSTCCEGQHLSLTVLRPPPYDPNDDRCDLFLTWYVEHPLYKVVDPFVVNHGYLEDSSE